jgi:chromosome segregation ATPase
MVVQHNLQANLAQRVGSLPVDPRLSTGTQVKGANIAIPGFMQKQISALEKELEKSNDEINQIQCQQGELQVKLDSNPDLADEINAQLKDLGEKQNALEYKLQNLQTTLENLKTQEEQLSENIELEKKAEEESPASQRLKLLQAAQQALLQKQKQSEQNTLELLG